MGVTQRWYTIGRPSPANLLDGKLIIMGWSRDRTHAEMRDPRRRVIVVQASGREQAARIAAGRLGIPLDQIVWRTRGPRAPHRA